MSAQEIEALIEEFTQCLEKQDVQGMVDMWTDDGRLLPPDAPAVEGKEAIAAVLKGFVDAGVTSGTFKTVNLEIIGDTAIRQGASELKATSPDGETVTQVSKSLEVFKRQPNGSWKLAAEAFNRDAPPAG